MKLPRFARGTAFRFSLLHTLVFVALVALVGAAAEMSVTHALEHQAVERIDAEIATLADDYEHEQLDGLKDAMGSRIAARTVRLRYALVGPDRQTILGDKALASYPSGMGGSSAAAPRTSRDDPTDRIVVGWHAFPDGYLVVVADDLESVEDVQHVISGAFLLALGLAVGLGLGAGAFLTRALLRRVEAITRTADAIISDDLGRRIPLRGTDDDFDHLAATLNAMLDRIAGLMDNLRQVTNDVAHDLRTPLSRLRQGLEDARNRATSTEEFREAVDRAVAEADGLLGTFSALLRIAQIESDARRAAFRRLDFSALVRGVADAFAPVAEDEGRGFSVVVADGIDLDGDPELLTQMLSNLVENALHHTPTGAAISISLRRSERAIALDVADRGPGVPAGEREKIFRRFYRLERSRTTSGNGLGLSLVAATAELHHASVQALDNAPGLRIAIRFAPRG